MNEKQIAEMTAELINPAYVVAYEMGEIPGPPAITTNDWIAANAHIMSLIGKEQYLQTVFRQLESVMAEDAGIFEDEPALDGDQWVTDNLRRMLDLGGPQQWLIWFLTTLLGRKPQIDKKAIRTRLKEMKCLASE